MNRRMVATLTACVVLVLAFAPVVFAEPVGFRVHADHFVTQWFVKHGVEAQYVGQPRDKVPEEVWGRMVALENDPELLQLVQQNLCFHFSRAGVQLYEQIGDIYYASRFPMGLRIPSFYVLSDG
jgi:hypothetical protein